MIKRSREMIARALEAIGQNLIPRDWVAIGLALLLGATFLISGGAIGGFWLFQVGLCILAVFLLMYGSDWFIQGATVIGLIKGMTLFAIGVIITAPGTTFPELFTNIRSVTAVDKIDFAIGNAVGSYTFNTLAIVGCASMTVLFPFFGERIAAWFKRRRAKKRNEQFVEVEYAEKPAVVDVPAHTATKTWFAMGFIVLLVILSWDGMLSWIDGIILTAFFGAWMVYIWFDQGKHKPVEISKEEEYYRHLTKEQRAQKTTGAIFIMLAGFFALAFGAGFLVSSAASLAKMAGLTEAFIGLTIVAMGTSAPEFVLSVSAVAKKRYELGIGNIIGADILDILMVLGASAVIRTIVSKVGVPFNTNALIDCVAAFVAMFLLWFALAVLKPRFKLTWQKGLFLFLPYVVYVLYILERDGSINLIKGLIGPS